MATHTGLNGVVKIGSNTVGEVTSFTLNQTQDTVEDTSSIEEVWEMFPYCSVPSKRQR